MMSSSYPTSYQRIDHRTVFKSLQLEANNCGSKETLIADIFRPITDIASHNKVKKGGSNNYSLPPNKRSTYYVVSQRPAVNTLSAKSKIPYPLTTIWTNKKDIFHSRRSSSGGGGVHRTTSNNNAGGGGSLRLRGSKSNLPLIMEPLTNETAATVKCTHQNTHDNTTTLTGGRVYTTRRKLALISQKPLADPLLKRSLSLRKNFKYSTKTDSPNQQHQTTQQQQASSCAAATTTINVKSLSVHDVAHATSNHNNIPNRDQGDGPQDNKMSAEQQQLSPDAVANCDKITRECRKLVSYFVIFFFRFI